MHSDISPGFYNDIAEAEYHDDRESLSVSGAKVLLKAPALFRWQQDHPVHKDVFDLGSAAHALVLGVGAEIDVLDMDSWRSKAAQEQREASRAEGHVCLLLADYRRVQAMADALSSHTLAMELLSKGEPEVSAYALDEQTGVMRRCRFDWLGERIGVDYKSTASADPDDLGGIVARYGYDMQCAYYTDIARDLGHPLEAFAFIFQMKEPPYLVTVAELDDAAIQRGRDRCRQALEMFRDCRDAGIWPGFTQPDEIVRVSLPRWAYYETTQEIA